MTRTNGSRDGALDLQAGLGWFASGLRRRVQIDLRALAAFRIAIGSLIVFDLILRARDFTAFYTDDGVLPTDRLYADWTEVNSLHAWLGDAWLVALLFVVAAAFGIAMILGYRTRTVTAVSWLLLFSLHNRNPMILNGGDVLFRMLVFWAIFLPLGERWSIDARRSDARWTDRDRSTVATLGTVAVLSQIALMYVSNFVHKTDGDAWLEGEAVAYILHLDHFTVYLGPYLAEQIELLRFFTYFWLFLMALSPFLFLLTGWPRAVLTTGFVGMHLGMAATLQIGIFPLVAVAGLLLFYPPVVWDRAIDLADRLGATERITEFRERLYAVIPANPFGGDRRVPISHEIPGLQPLLSTVIPGLFIVLIVTSNAHALGYVDEPPEQGQSLLDETDTEQSWQVFAPDPLTVTRWYVAETTLEDGQKTDAFTGDPVDFDRPPNPADRARNARWRKYLANVYSSNNENHQSYLANYLCGEWNRSQDTKAVRVEFHALQDPERPFGGDEDLLRTRLINYDCSGPLIQP